MNFTPFPTLSSKRLLLRQLGLADEKEILFLRSDPRILEFIDISVAENVEDARAYIEKMNRGIEHDEWIFWGITIRENTQKIIGTICLWNLVKKEKKAEIGYVLHPDYQGNGYMQEAVEQVLNFGFETMGLNIIDANFHAENIKSLKLLNRNNFVFHKKEGDYLIYILTKESWLS